jgi:hypothetical protein
MGPACPPKTYGLVRRPPRYGTRPSALLDLRACPSGQPISFAPPEHKNRFGGSPPLNPWLALLPQQRFRMPKTRLGPSAKHPSDFFDPLDASYLIKRRSSPSVGDFFADPVLLGC